MFVRSIVEVQFWQRYADALLPHRRPQGATGGLAVIAHRCSALRPQYHDRDEAPQLRAVAPGSGGTCAACSGFAFEVYEVVKIIPYEDLSRADLLVDAVYEGGATGNVTDDVLSILLPGSGNQGGFRAAGRGDDKDFVVLYSSGRDPDWPDYLDTSSGRFEYFGDNKRPGHELHETSRGGNRILRHVFELLHSAPPRRESIPPFFVFESSPTPDSGRSVRYRGLAVPGAAQVPATDDLLALWKTTRGERFQNYRAIFSILDAAQVSRSWLNDIVRGDRHSPNAPAAWQEWVHSGRYRALQSENTTVIRGPDEQLPDTREKIAILENVWQHFREAPHAFERFAAWLLTIHDQKAIIDEVTRPSVDGGRDAIGRYVLGIKEDPVHVDFSLEAKCYRPALHGERGVSVGVADTSRLVSRILHRQFGVLVTTSVVGRQAYQEIRRDRHPIVFICGRDIADILTERGLGTAEMVQTMLDQRFPV